VTKYNVQQKLTLVHALRIIAIYIM